jgi:hypothetical protein
MPPAGFEPAIPASERPQTHALDVAATGIGVNAITVQAWRGPEDSSPDIKTIGTLKL